MVRVITFGTFDLFHIGHLNILERCKSLGDQLIVGISSDDLNFTKKGRYPFVSEADRSRIVMALSVVDKVFIEESLDLKGEYIKKFNADILAMGDDWAGKFDEFSNLCEVVYFDRTPTISTTALIETVVSASKN
jgi:glycerol-3-phosphate cytidylyltransferase